jgi:hypothetical protein
MAEIFMGPAIVKNVKLPTDTMLNPNTDSKNDKNNTQRNMVI